MIGTLFIIVKLTLQYIFWAYENSYYGIRSQTPETIPQKVFEPKF